MTYTPALLDRLLKPAKGTLGDALAANQSAIEYNGFKFPPATKSNAKMTPVYDDSGRVLKYMRLEIKVSFYLLHGMMLGTNGSGANNLYSGSYNYVNSHMPTSIQDADHTTDDEMDYIRATLLQPCQLLRFESQGLGSVLVQDGSSTRRDVDNGPKPKLVTWKPLTNKVCYVEWEVSTTFLPCDTFATLPYVGFSYDANFTVSKEGLTTRRISGQIEIPLTRRPLTAVVEADVSDDFNFANIRNDILAFFPMLPRFHRTQDYKVTTDRKYVQFTLTDTEINSEEAFGPGIVYGDVKITSANRKAMVLSQFDVTLGGTLHLAAGFPKSYALDEISRIFKKVFTDSYGLGSKFIEASADASDSEHREGSPTLAEMAQKSTAYLTNVSFTDNLFDRSVSFSIRWWLFTTLKTLFDATGMFVPLSRRPGDTFEAYATRQQANWEEWKGKMVFAVEDGGFSGLSMNQDDDLIISICHQQTIPDAPAAKAPPEYEDPEVNEDGHVPPGNRQAYDSWMHFDSKFDLETKEHTTHHAMLGDYESTIPTILSADATRLLNDNNGGETGGVDFDTNPQYIIPAIPDTPDANQSHKVHNRREPTYILHHKGTAIRLNYPVPVPKVEKAYGHTPRRIGTTIANHRYLGSAINLETGKAHKVYGLMWHVTYALPAPPTSSKIKTDAHVDTRA